MKRENVPLYELVKEAERLFIKNDIDLLERPANERSVAFRLGYYLQSIIMSGDYGFNRWTVVDAEFNKNGRDTKHVYMNCKYSHDGCNEYGDCYIKSDRQYYTFENYSNKYTLFEYAQMCSELKYMIPDLLLHERMPSGNKHNKNNNYIAIEIKLNHNIDANAIDFAKLTYLTCRTAEYQYRLGLHLESIGRKFLYTLFEDGRKVSLKIEE